jgi:hypothetical protein
MARIKSALTLCATAAAALLLGVSNTGIGSTAGSSPPAQLQYSAALCAWLQANANSLPSQVKPCLQSVPNKGQFPQNGAAGSSASSGGRGMSATSPSVLFGTNVAASDQTEDLAPGQSETAIAAMGNNVVSAWNDATGFLVSDPTKTQASLTGIGFSSDGGQTFSDLVGLPNTNPCQQEFGDASVVSYKDPSTGTVYFYVTSLYLPVFSTACFQTSSTGGSFDISLSVGVVARGGQAITFGNPIVVANGGSFFTFPNTAFLDKDFAAVDRAHGKIAISYTCFGFGFFGSGGGCGFAGEVDLAVCDISNPAAPTCTPGNSGPQFITVQPADNVTFEENEGAYPTFGPNGDVYVAWENNWATNIFNCLFAFFGFSCDTNVHIMAGHVLQSCLSAGGTASSARTAGPPCVTVVPIDTRVRSLDMLIFIAGYNRFFTNDFPRVAYNAATNRLWVVWNEANAHWMGDIVYVTTDGSLGSPSSKIRVNDDTSSQLHMLPAVSVGPNGDTNISWFDRRNSAGSARTDVFAASIKAGDVAAQNSKVTSVASDWLGTSSFIIPNFGDYTDNTSDGSTFYVNWSDGRLGIPQSFVASAATH